MDVFIQNYHQIVLLGFGALLPLLVCACAIAVLIEHGAPLRERMAAFIAGHPFLGRLVFSVLLAGFISYGSTKDGGSTNAPPPRLSAPAPRQAATPPESVATVTSNELATGWRLLAETGTDAFAEVPEGAITNEFWHRRGAFDDAMRLSASNWSFRARSGPLEGVTAFSIRGKNPRDTTVRAYITAHVPAQVADFAWMIVKHGSKPDSGDRNRFYNQFNPHGKYAEQANLGLPDGWGIAHPFSNVYKISHRTGTTRASP